MKVSDFFVDKALERLNKAVSGDRFFISRGINRKENDSFLKKYLIKPKKQKEIFLSLKHENFSGLKIDDKNSSEYLYVFRTKYKLSNTEGIYKEIEIYIKFKFETNKKEDNLVCISFHPN